MGHFVPATRHYTPPGGERGVRHYALGSTVQKADVWTTVGAVAAGVGGAFITSGEPCVESGLCEAIPKREIFLCEEEAMTFEDLDRDLPNGFHDAKIESVTVDYVQRSAVIAMRLLVGTPTSADQDEYRGATLRVSGLCYYAIDAPDPAYPFMRTGSAINVAGYPEDPKEFPALDGLLPAMPKDVACYRFFVQEWNAFIHIAAMDVRLSWAGDEARKGVGVPAS
jgi:hypothetical protein